MLHVAALSWSLFALRQMEKAVQLVKRSANLGIRYLIDFVFLSNCLSLSFPVLSKHINIRSHQLATCWHGILCIFTFYLCLWWSNFMAANLSLHIMAIKANAALFSYLHAHILEVSSDWGQYHSFTWCSLVMVYMTDGGVTAKSTCLPHTPRQGGPVVSYISVLLFGSVL